jgi:ATP-dependent Lhr-like helicase
MKVAVSKPRMLGSRAARALLDEWFASKGWKPLPFQREVWRRYLAGESGLLHTPTGSGKTLAALGGPLLEAIASDPSPLGREVGKKVRTPATRPLKLLWITPLRALASDTARALREPIDALGLDWQLGLRTGDASARDKRLARGGKLDALVTTPESLALLLSYPDTAPQLASLRAVVIDEWHELLGNKRGVLLQLCLARVRLLASALRIWGLSATLGNLDEARDVLLPHASESETVSGVAPRTVTLESLVPDEGERFPWAGHLGLSQLSRVVDRVFEARTSLVFTNTRATAELWHRALSAVWLEESDTLALHHGSLDPKLRAATEAGLRDGRLRCVVATSSLDLGVDFPAVDQVFQVGSPKGASRLLQRAGRAKHRPGEAGHVICVPTNALELVEFAAVRRAIADGRIESRAPPRLSLDVLAQHCVTIALGGATHERISNAGGQATRRARPHISGLANGRGNAVPRDSGISAAPTMMRRANGSQFLQGRTRARARP